MRDQRYDLFRLYLANMEQYTMAKRFFGLAVILLGLIAGIYIAVIQRNYSGLWIIFAVLLFFYFILGSFLVGAMVFGPPDRIVKRVSGQKLKKPDETNAGELAATAATLVRNGNLAVARDLLDQVFALKNVGPKRLMFANTVLAEAQLVEGDVDQAFKTLKGSALKKSGDAGAYTFFVLGRILLKQENYSKAIEAFQDAADYLGEGHIGIPDMYKQKARNRSMRNIYGETLQVFVPFYLGKAHFWAPKGDEQVAGKQLNSAVVLCRNRNFRPLLKQDFSEKE